MTYRDELLESNRVYCTYSLEVDMCSVVKLLALGSCLSMTVTDTGAFVVWISSEDEAQNMPIIGAFKVTIFALLASTIYVECPLQ